MVISQTNSKAVPLLKHVNHSKYTHVRSQKLPDAAPQEARVENISDKKYLQ